VVGPVSEETMNKFIANSTADSPLGIPPGRKCLIVPSGQYAGRVAILYAASPSNIKLVSADPPFANFSSPSDVVTDSADTPFDAHMNSDGDIYVAYIETSTNDLKFVKLTFDGGTWLVGAPATVYDGGDSSYPCICKLSAGRLWIAYTRLSGVDYYISAKVSTDDGETWTAASDPGDTLTSGDDSAYCKMVERNQYQYVFYSEGGDRIACRSKAISAVIWGSEVVLASEGGYDENFTAAVSPDGRIGVAYVSATGLKFREYNGSYWSGEATLDNNTVVWPVVSYQGGEAYVLYARSRGSNMNQAFYTKKENDSFSSPEPLDTRKADLKKLLLYNASAGSYEDKTNEAASSDMADVFHSASSALLLAIDDALFIGIDEPFNYLHLLLSTTGAGGEVNWKYWDGQKWKAFTPVSGTWHFTAAEHDLLLWSDFDSIPDDWQKKTISESSCYWIVATVMSAFTTAPVGSRINAISNLKAISAQV
jgi:hypothetical protein